MFGRVFSRASIHNILFATYRARDVRTFSIFFFTVNSSIQISLYIMCTLQMPYRIIHAYLHMLKTYNTYINKFGSNELFVCSFTSSFHLSDIGKIIITAIIWRLLATSVHFTVFFFFGYCCFPLPRSLFCIACVYMCFGSISLKSFACIYVWVDVNGRDRVYSESADRGRDNE